MNIFWRFLVWLGSFRPIDAPAPLPSPEPNRRGIRPMAMAQMGASGVKSYDYPIQPVTLPRGVVPQGAHAPALAADAMPEGGGYGFAGAYISMVGFPGYPYLAQLSLRAEYRAFAAAFSTELTREWIELTCSETASDETKAKIAELTQKIDYFKIKNAIQLAAEHDSFFGRGQIFLSLKNKQGLPQNQSLPLILDPRTIPLGSFDGVKVIEAMWTTPNAYNAIDPTAKDYYVPSSWFVMGKKTHSTRLLTIITREVPDMLKAAFNFGGMSLSQLAEPYVDNWLRTRQSVSDLVNNFSVLVLKTRMDQLLAGEEGSGGDGSDLITRLKFFTATRSNMGIMGLDTETEELEQLAVPLGGLHELQSQAQEHMCSVSHMPAIILTGISPSGLNASSDGEIRCWYDWIHALQEYKFRSPIKTILDVIQLSEYGLIDPEISFNFRSLYQMTPKEQAELNKSKADADNVYLAAGVVDADEVRQKLANDPKSGYEGLDTSVTMVDPNDSEEQDDEDE